MDYMSDTLRGFAVKPLWLLWCLALSTACSPTNHYFPVTDHKERNSTLGFSITPPPGFGWYEKLHDDTLYYLKKIPTDEYAIYTKATELRFTELNQSTEDFIDFVEENKKRAMTHAAFRNPSLRVALLPQTTTLCVRYTQEYEDHGTKGGANGTFIKIRKSGQVCKHPNNPSNGIDVHYVEASRPFLSFASVSYQEEGEFFLSSLRFFPEGGKS